MSPPTIAVVGSVNLDIVASAARLPTPGETVAGAGLSRYPGGKGANQALAARRLGADVKLYARVGRDSAADDALALLRHDEVDLGGVLADDARPTGVALIVVAPDGENQIVVASEANAAFTPDHLTLTPADAVICQLEIPVDTVMEAARQTAGLFCLNVAPATPLPRVLLDRADLIVANESEAGFFGDELSQAGGRLALTLGARGAVLFANGDEIARAAPPVVQAVDAVGAGDAFVAALVVSLLEGLSEAEALSRACAAGAFAAARPGAQTSFATAVELAAFQAAT